MEATVVGNGDAAIKGPPPPPSPLTGCYLLIVVGEPHSDEHRDIILQRIAKGLLSWDLENCHVDLEKELQAITSVAPEGEEARHGERLIQFATENLVTEVLIHPAANTLIQCMKNLLSSFTRHRHIIHAGYTFGGSGSWALQDGTFSLADFSEAFQENEVQRVLRAYENTITIDIHCSAEGDWTRLPKESFAKSCKVQVNPNDVLTSGSPSINGFLNYLSPFLIPSDIETLLESSDVVGNIRFSHPTLYVFPGGQGDAALFGINGFNMLVDGGFARKACFWDFTRHLDRLDAVLVTRLNNSNVCGISSVLRRKTNNQVYPQIGHFFCNLQERKAISPDGDKDKDPLLINLLDEGHNIILNLRQLNLRPQPCYRDTEPINLYHKVGHGTLDMYVLSPAKDSKEVKEFMQKWNSNDQKLFTTRRDPKEFVFPSPNLVSICALLVWQPANPTDTITRLLFPGSTPQHKIFEGLDRLKHLEFMKHPVCTAKTLTPSGSILGMTKTRQAKTMLDKILPEQRSQRIIDNKPIKEKSPPQNENKQKVENKQQNENKLNGTTIEENKTEKVIKSDSVESEKSEPPSETKKTEINGKDVEIILENKSDIKEKPKSMDAKPKVENKHRAAAKLRSESATRKSMEKRTSKVEKKIESKPSPPTPKKTVDLKVNGVAKEKDVPKPKLLNKIGIKSSPSATPAKSTKDANNRKVVESKYKAPLHTIKKETVKSTAPAPDKKEPNKVERKPISKRPKAISPARTGKVPASPSKKPGVKADKNGISRTIKLEKEGTTDSSAVSTPSADQDTKKIDESKLTKIELDELKAKELADLKEEQEVVKEIEAVFRKDEQSKITEQPDLRKVKDISIEDKTTEPEDDEEEEYLIVEKEEVEQNTDSINEQESAAKEDEIQKHQRDSEESEKPRKGSDADKANENIVIQEEKQEQETKLIETETCKVLEIVPPTKDEEEVIAPTTEMTRSKEDSRDKTEEMSKEISVTSPEDKIDVSSEKKLTDTRDVEEEENKEVVDQNVLESHPDEKFSATIESGATTAPTLPEDERIPLDEIKEDQVIEEKHVKEETKEKEIPTVVVPQKTIEPVAKISPIIGMKFDAHQSHIRDIVKTPDEVADLPVHEEVDIDTYDFPGTFKKDEAKKVETTKKDAAVLEEVKDIKNKLEEAATAVNDIISNEIENIKEKIILTEDKIKSKEIAMKQEVVDTLETDTQQKLDKTEKQIADVTNELKDVVTEKLEDVKHDDIKTVEKVKEESLLQKVEDTSADITKAIGDGFEDIEKKITDAIDTGKEKLEEKKDEIKEKIDDIGTEIAKSEKIDKIKSEVLKMGQTLEEKIHDVTTNLEDKAHGLETKIEDKINNVKKLFENSEDIILEKLKDDELKIEEKITDAKDAVAKAQVLEEKTKEVETKDEEIESKVDNKINEIKDINEKPEHVSEDKADKIELKAVEKITDTKDAVAKAEQVVDEKTKENKFSEVKDIFERTEHVLEEKVKDVKSKIDDKISEVKDIFGKSEQATEEKEKEIETKIEDRISEVKDIFGKIEQTMEEKEKEIETKIEDKISEVKDSFEKTEQTLEEKTKDLGSKVTEIILDAKDTIVNTEHVLEDKAKGIESKIEEKVMDTKDVIVSTEHILEENIKEMESKFGEKITDTKDAIINAEHVLGEKVKDVESKIEDKFSDLKDIFEKAEHVLAEKAKELGSKIEEKIIDSKNAIVHAEHVLEEKVNEVESKVEEKIIDAKDAAVKMEHKLEEKANEFESKIEETLLKTDVATKNKDKFEETKDVIVKAQETTEQKAHESAIKLENQILDQIEDIKVKEKVDKMEKEIKDETSSIFEKFKHSIEEDVEIVKEKASALGKGIKEEEKIIEDKLSSTITSIENVVAEKTKHITEDISKVVDGIHKKEEEIVHSIKETVHDIKDSIEEKIDETKAQIANLTFDSDESFKQLEEPTKIENDTSAVISDAKDIVTDIINEAETKTTEPEKVAEDVSDLTKEFNITKEVSGVKKDITEKLKDEEDEKHDKFDTDVSIHNPEFTEDREADIVKIVTNVAHVLKSDAPLEELASTLPIEYSSPFKSFGLKGYTTELRETHITTVDSPVREDAVIPGDIEKPVQETEICPKQSSLSFLDEERKIALEDKSETVTQDTKISDLIKDSNDFIASTTKIISDIKSGSGTEIQSIQQNEDFKTDEIEKEPLVKKDSGIVHRMLVTASSEDGGEETVICPPGSIIYNISDSSPKSTPQDGLSGRSTPEDLIDDKESIKSSIDTQISKDESKKIDSGKSTPEIKETLVDENIQESKKIDQISSGKSSPDIKEEHQIHSGKSSPEFKTKINDNLLDESLSDLKKDDHILSEKSTSEIKSDVKESLSGKSTSDIIKVDDILSGKSTPEKKVDIDKLEDVKKDSNKILSGTSTPDLKKETDSIISGKDTPDIQDSLSRKSTPDLKKETDSIISGKDTPDIQDSLSRKSTPDIRKDDNILSGKSSPDLKDSLSGKSTPDIKIDNLILSGKATPDQKPSNENISGTTTPDIKDDKSKLTEKLNFDITSGKSSPDGKEQHDIKSTEVSSIHQVEKSKTDSNILTENFKDFEQISSGKSTPDIKDSIKGETSAIDDTKPANDKLDKMSLEMKIEMEEQKHEKISKEIDVKDNKVSPDFKDEISDTSTIDTVKEISPVNNEKNITELKEDILHDMHDKDTIVTKSESEVSNSKDKDDKIVTEKKSSDTASDSKIEDKDNQIIQPGKVTPEIKEEIKEDKDGPPEKEDVKERKDSLLDHITDSGKSTPALETVLKDDLSYSGKSTPDMKQTEQDLIKSATLKKDNESTETDAPEKLRSVISVDTELHKSGKSSPDPKSDEKFDIINKPLSDIKQAVLDLSGKSSPDIKESLSAVSSAPDISCELKEETTFYIEKEGDLQLSGKSTPDMKNLSGKSTPFKDELHNLSRTSSPDIKTDLKEHIIDAHIELNKSDKISPPLKESSTNLFETEGSTKVITDVKDSGKSTPELKTEMKDVKDISLSSNDNKKVGEQICTLDDKVSKISPELSCDTINDKSKTSLESLENKFEIKSSDKTSSDLVTDKTDVGKTAITSDKVEIKTEIKDDKLKHEHITDISSTLVTKESSSLESKTDTTYPVTSDDIKDDRKPSVSEDSKVIKTETPRQSIPNLEETKPYESGKSTPDISKSTLPISTELSGKSTPDLKHDNISARSTPDIQAKDLSGKSTPDIKISSGKASPDTKKKILPIEQDKDKKDLTKDDSSSGKDSFSKEIQPTVITTEVTDLSIAGPSCAQREDSIPSSGQISPLNKDIQNLSSEDLHLSGKSTPDIADVERMKEMHEILKHEKHIPGSSTPPTVPVSPIVKETFSLQSEETKHIEKQDRDEDTKKDKSEQKPASESTQPTVTTTVIEKQDNKVKTSEETLKTKESISDTPSKGSDIRCSTPGSDDYELGGVSSPHSDISSGQMSRVAHAWGHGSSEERQAYSDDEDVPGSPTSVTSQMAQSPTHFGESEFDVQGDNIIHKVGKHDPMNTSFYGALPDEPLEEATVEHKTGTSQPIPITSSTKAHYEYPASSEKRFLDEADLDFEKAMLEHRQTRGSDLLASGAESLNYKYEITTAKFSKVVKEGGVKTVTDGIPMKEINKNGFDKGFDNIHGEFSAKPETPRKSSPEMMTSSFIEGSSSSQPSSQEIKKDPIESWGKPLGLPSPALPPTSDLSNKTTPKKMPPSATLAAKNKINDERKRSDSPSKYDKKNRKINPVYMDLTYVPHHGNSYYSFVEFFKRVRARYYVFSGTEPSRDVYNALLEAKQTWEDKDLEVTIIPTYDTDVLGYWVAENEDLLAKYKIDLSPSASRCTINLQDHETSCSAYRLEF